MGRDSVNLVVVGRHFALGRSATRYGIWRRDDATKGRPGRAIQEFPLTDEGWAAAWAQYSSWEPASNPTQETVTSAYETSSVTHGAPQAPSVRSPRPAPTRRPRVAPWRWAVSTAACAVVIAAAAAVVVASQPSGAQVAAKSSTPGTRVAAHAAVPPRAPTVTAVPVSGTGYLANGAGMVVFIQWTNEHGILAGTAEVVSIEGAVPKETVKTKAMNLVGAEHGSTVMLKLDSQPGAFGTVTGHGFTLNFPAADGSLVPLTFTDAGAPAFNTALGAVRQQVAAANQAAADAESRLAARDKISTEAAAVSADVDRLLPQQLQVLNSAITAVGKALTAANSDTAATQAATQAVSAEASQYQADGNAGVCADAGGVAAHARGVASDAASAGAAAQEVGNDAASVRQDVSQLSGDWSKLQADETASAASPTPSGPSAKQVSDALAAADSTAAQAVSGTNAQVDQVNSDVTAAFGYAASAYGAGRCGLAPTPPVAQKHIS